MTKPMFTGSAWNFQLLDRIEKEVMEIGNEELHLEMYPNQFEICTSDQMLGIYADSFPVHYRHWSSGKAYAREKHNYNQKHGNLAYEVVFNTTPCINFLQEENSATMMALTMAHAGCGHNSFFAMNELFLQHTDAKNILNYMIYARDFVDECEQKYGTDAVEGILDSCHALKYYSVDKFKRPEPLSKDLQKAKERENNIQKNKQVDALWDHIVPTKEVDHNEEPDFEHEENVLYFIEMHAPHLQTWERELIRIVRKIAQYFYPQYQTSVLNEGHASFTHYFIMTRLMEKGLITEGSYLEFLHSHTGVVNQYPGQPSYNPYYLGFNMLMENKRICQEPTKEDEKYFPSMVGTDWLKQHHFAIRNFRDESFVMQYLSPAMVRKERMFVFEDNADNPNFKITSIQNERGFEGIRSALSDRYKLSNFFADIQVIDADLKGDRTLTLLHTIKDGIMLDRKTAQETVNHVENLWGYPVTLISKTAD
jgi:stage V sporulation protein R